MQSRLSRCIMVVSAVLRVISHTGQVAQQTALRAAFLVDQAIQEKQVRDLFAEYEQIG